MNAIAIAQAIQLITLATEAAAAASRISALIAQRQAAGTELSEQDWAELINDRAVAQAMLLASISKRQAGGS